jgi:hypothetical protein
MRVESEHTCASGGWYHFYDKPNPDFLPAQRREAPARSIKAFEIMENFRRATLPHHYICLAEELGVTPESLVRIGAGWAESYKAWAFPMKDGLGNTVGIRLRNKAGFKWAVRGSAQGVFVPAECDSQIAYLPEGPTDACAAISIGLFPIGRPSCNAGADIIAATLKRLGIFKAVIIADNDEIKTLGQKQGRPGAIGALQLKKAIGVKSVIWTPPDPIKDLRQFVKQGGNAIVIESQIRNKVWSRK